MTSLDDVLSLGRNLSSRDARFLEWLDALTSNLEKVFDLDSVKRYVKRASKFPKLTSFGPDLDAEEACDVVTVFCKLKARLTSNVIWQAYFTFCKNDEDLKDAFHRVVQSDRSLVNVLLQTADDYASSSLSENAYVNASFFEKAASLIVNFCSKLFWEALEQNDALKKSAGSYVVVDKFKDVLVSSFAEFFPKPNDEEALKRGLSVLEAAKPFFLSALLRVKTHADLRKYSFWLSTSYGLRNVNHLLREDAVEFLESTYDEIRSIVEVQDAALKRDVSLDVTDAFTYPFFKFFGLTSEWLDLVEARTKSSNDVFWTWIGYAPPVYDFVSRVWQVKKEGVIVNEFDASKRACEVLRDFLKFLVKEKQIFFALDVGESASDALPDRLNLLRNVSATFQKVFSSVVKSFNEAFFAVTEEEAEAGLRNLESQVQLFYDAASFLRDVDDETLSSIVDLNSIVNLEKEPEVLSQFRTFLLGTALGGLFAVDPGLSQVAEGSKSGKSSLVKGLLVKWLNGLSREEKLKSELKYGNFVDFLFINLLQKVFVKEVERAKKECVDRLKKDFGIKPNVFLR